MSITTFGEIMLRLTPSLPAEKINYSRAFDVNYAGSESNVASALSLLGNHVQFVTKLPKNQLGDAAIHSLKSYGIATENCIRGGKKIGIYFIEIGSSIRPSSVIYDRQRTAFSEINESEFDWFKILKGQNWLHISGITPALSHQCAVETIKATKIAKELGLQVSFDMNYRRTLWESPLDARNIFNEIIKNTDLLFGNTGVLKDVYDMDFEGASETDRTIDAVYKAQEKFKIAKIAFTVRDHSSASENELSSVFLSNSERVISKKYKVLVTDRFGTGDAFAASCLHGLKNNWTNQKTIDFATAAFALKHTIQGDQHTSSEDEIISIMNGNTSGHVLR